MNRLDSVVVITITLGLLLEPDRSVSYQRSPAIEGSDLPYLMEGIAPARVSLSN